jgi:hypothetical protein
MRQSRIEAVRESNQIAMDCDPKTSEQIYEQLEPNVLQKRIRLHLNQENQATPVASSPWDHALAKARHFPCGIHVGKASTGGCRAKTLYG